MRYSNDPSYYIIPLLILGTIALVVALKQEKPIDRFRWSAFVLLGYGTAIIGSISNFKITIIGLVVIFIAHFLIFRTSEEFFNKYIRRK